MLDLLVPVCWGQDWMWERLITCLASCCWQEETGSANSESVISMLEWWISSSLLWSWNNCVSQCHLRFSSNHIRTIKEHRWNLFGLIIKGFYIYIYLFTRVTEIFHQLVHTLQMATGGQNWFRLETGVWDFFRVSHMIGKATGAWAIFAALSVCWFICWFGR